jgi:hypothetical protein
MDGANSFRKRFRAGKPNRAAIIWAQLRGYCDAQGQLTEAGRRWVSARDSALRTGPPSRTAIARKAGGTRALAALQARLLLAELRARGGSERGDVDTGDGALERGGDRTGLRKSRPDGISGRVDAFREWAAGQVRASARVDQRVDYAELRKRNAERMRAVYGP